MTQYETKDSGERQEYDSGMRRDLTKGKTKWHLVFSGPMLERWAKLMTRGAEKYDDDNWMKANSKEEQDRFRASAFRHFMQWYGGDTDEDHAAAVIFNINGLEYVKDRLADELPLAAKDWSWMASVERYEAAKRTTDDDATVAEIPEMYNE